MFRYFAFLWHDVDPAASATAHRLIARCLEQSSAWQRVLAEPGMAVLCTATAGICASRSLIGAEGRALGVVLGDLFRISRDATGSSVMHTGRCNRLTVEEAERIVRSSGRELISSYWGNYVAILRDPETRTRWVLRSPAAVLPCLRSRIDAVSCIHAWAEDTPHRKSTSSPFPSGFMEHDGAGCIVRNK